MISDVDKTGTLEGFTQVVERVAKDPEVNALIILACSDNGFTPAQIDPVLHAIDKPLMGGVFPAVMVGGERLATGTVVWGVRRPVSISVLQNVSDPSIDMVEALEQALPDEMPDNALQIVFVDGFSRRIGALTTALHELVGLTTDTVGGGAGSLDFIQRPCLFTAQGMLEDAAVVATVAGRAGVGVAHGWSTIGGPFRVTESDQNTIISLDWRPAFEVYREVVEAHSGQTFNDSNFFDIAKAYPFGIARLDAERIVRDPLTVGEDNSLTCVGEVPQGEHVDILHGDRPSLLSAAGRAREIADQRLGEPAHVRLFMDCISRVLFLDEAFEQEVLAVKHDDAPLLGACTIGEVANHGGEFVEFYNKTAVVATLPAAELV